MYETLVAIVLIISPPNPDVRYDNLKSDSMGETLRRVCVSMELLDPKEQNNWFGQFFTEDIKSIQVRYRDLKDAPPAGFASFLPTEEICQARLEFNKKYQKHIENIAICYPYQSDLCDIVIEETKQLYYVHETVSECHQNYIYQKRMALKRLRDKIGEEYFYSGRLPPHVPIWRFRSID